MATLVSRITGLLRTMVLAAALGVGLVNDAYNTANTLPNIVYELLLGGVLTSVVVPLLVHAQERDRDGGVAYAQRLATIATAGLVVVTGAGDPRRAAAHLAVRHHRRRRAGAAGQLAGPDPADRDRLLRRRRPGPGDPELARRLRPARLGAGAQQRRRHRHRPAVHRRQRPGRPRAGDDHADGQVWLLGIGTHARHRRRRPLVLLPLLAQGRRAAAAAVGPARTPGCARRAPSASGSSATSRSARSASSSPPGSPTRPAARAVSGSSAFAIREPAVPDALRDHRRRAADRAACPG